MVKGYISLNTTFRVGVNANIFIIRFFVVSAPSSYNIIIGCQAFNLLYAILSTLYLTMKYPLEGGMIEALKGNQDMVRKCYQDTV